MPSSTAFSEGRSQTSTIHLKVTDGADGAITGEADFLEVDNWSLDKNTNPDVINVLINNSEAGPR